MEELGAFLSPTSRRDSSADSAMLKLQASGHDVALQEDLQEVLVRETCC